MHARQPFHWAASTALVSSWRSQLFFPPQRAEAELQGSVEAERRRVAELRARADEAAVALERERGLVAKLTSEMKAASADSARVVGWVGAG